jgi:hypothetical protein
LAAEWVTIGFRIHGNYIFEAGAWCSGFLTSPHTTAINYGDGGRKIQNMKAEISIKLKEDKSIDWYCEGNSNNLAVLLSAVAKCSPELHAAIIIAGKKLHSDIQKLPNYVQTKGEA